jgi:thiamine-phosphate pyrophosphorylase
MLRIIDANLNRATEGLRVLEDIARFLLNDPSLSVRLKSLRHELLPSDGALQRQMLAARNSEGDIAAFAETPEEIKRDSALSLVIANAKRVQESLRVLEETTKLHQIPALDWTKFKDARFTLYELEQMLVSRLLRRDKLQNFNGLYVLIDAQALEGRSEVGATRKAIQGGAKIIQLRDKKRSIRELLPVAQELKELCLSFGIPFLINDYLSLALAVDADGLHLGQDDLPLPVARRLLPQDKILGCSTATVEEARKAEEEGADYIAVGSIFRTPSKPEARLAGLETLRRVREITSKPLVAIGGIDEDNVAEVLAAGADTVAVISSVLRAEDVEEAAHRLASKIELSRRESE